MSPVHCRITRILVAVCVATCLLLCLHLAPEAHAQEVFEPSVLSESTGDGKVDEKAAAFKISAELGAGDGRSLRSETFFFGRYAIELKENSTEAEVVYDLGEMSWREASSGRVVLLSEAQAWVEETVEKTKASIATVPDGPRKQFAERMIDPAFEVTEESGRLIVKNEYVSYEVTASQSFSEEQASRFFAYDRLSAYRKAMNESQFPPYPQLAVTKELEARKVMPNQIKLTLITPLRGEVEYLISIAVGEVTEAERTSLEGVLRE